MAYGDSALLYAPVHHNKDIVDLLGVCFSSSDNGPRKHVVSMSIGVGVFAGDALYDSLANGFATTEAYVGANLVPKPYPSELEYLLEMHYMTPLQMVLLRLRHMWARPCSFHL